MELRRLVESSPDALTRDLLGSGLKDAPAPYSAPRIAAALGLAAGVTGAGIPAIAASSGASGAMLTGSTHLGPLVLAKWLGAGLLAGTVASGGAVILRGGALPLERTTPTAAATATRVTPNRPAGAAPAWSRADATSPAVASGAPAHKPPTPNVERPLQASEPAVARLPDETSALAYEVARIDEARVALRGGDARATLTALTRYDEERQTRVLDREAAVLRIEALVLAGRRSEARQQAQRYLDRYPADAHTAGLRELVRSIDETQGIDQ